MVFLSFFNLCLNLEIRNLLSEPQSAPTLDFADCVELLYMVFPVVMYGCEIWTVKKAEH